MGIQRPADGRDCCSGHQGATLEGGQVVTQAGGQPGLLAHDAQGPAQTAVAQTPAKQGGQQNHQKGEHQKANGIVGAWPAIEQGRQITYALRAFGQPGLVVGNGANDFGNGQGDNGPVIGAQLAAQPGNDPAQADRQTHAGNGTGERPPAFTDEDTGTVGTNARKDNMTEIEQPGVSGLQIQAQGHQGINAGNGKRRNNEFKHA